MNSFEKVQPWKVIYLSREKGNKLIYHKWVKATNVRRAMNKAIKILPGNALIVSIGFETEERRKVHDSQSEAFI